MTHISFFDRLENNFVENKIVQTTQITEKKKIMSQICVGTEDLKKKYVNWNFRIV